MITMTRTATFVTVSTESFAWWMRRNRVPWPAPLNASPAARVEIDLEELILWRDEDGDRAVRVTNEVNARMAMKFPADWPSSTCEVAEEMAAILADAEWAVFATRAEVASHGEMFAAGVSGGPHGACVVDDGATVSFAVVESTDASGALARAISPRSGKTVSFRPFTMSKNIAAGLGGGPGSAVSVFKKARVDAADAAMLAEIEARATAGGVIGATRFEAGHDSAAPAGAQWLESPLGGVLTLGDGDGSVSFDPLSQTSLTRAVASVIAAVR